ncbi:MAG: (d)CMP kinase [Candidatus Bathyarchaeia archaeon]|jgi:cytidylate kinase
MFSPERTKGKVGKPVVICIGGMAGSGKSTLARKLAEKYKLGYLSGGDALRALAVEEGYRSLGRGWWESREGMRFLEEREKDNRFDEAVDRKLLQMAHKGNVILDSWTMPWLLERAFKIWLEASPEKRAKRIAGRDRISFKDALNALKRKEEQTKAIYKKLYGFNLGEDFAPFNFILDTDNLKSEEVFQIVCMVIDNVAFSS